MSSPSSPSRPLTPFPHTHTLTHGSNHSYFHHIQFEVQPHAYEYTSQPIHFHLKPRHTPVPPSLIRRGSSSKRVSASSASSSRPEIIAPIPRRASSSTSSTSSYSNSTSSPLMPITPILESPSNLPSMSVTPLSLPPPLTKSLPSFPNENEVEEKEYSNLFNYDPYSISLSTGEEIASTYNSYSSLSSSPIKRPTFKRRDTPIPPTSTFNSLKMNTIKDENGRKYLRSIIDGGNWVIVG